MEATPSLSAVQTHSAGWGVVTGVLVDSSLFYLVAIFLLSYIGLSLSALALPKSLRPVGWLIAPYLGFSTLVTLSGLMVALGANVRTSLAAALLLSTVANLWLAYRGRKRLPSGSASVWMILLVLLSAASYAITAATMAHNGSLAYVGGQVDLYLLVPIAEWLKTHSASLFSLGPSLGLDPYWNANLTPMASWLSEGAHLGGAGHRFDDTNFLMQRGPAYFEASLGLLLGWDSYAVFRPTQAFMLSLSVPATFLFSRRLLRGAPITSFLSALFVGLNGTLFFWVSFAHPGQAVGLFLAPVAILLALSAMESKERLPILSAAVVLSALLVSYYQGAPLLLFLLGPGIVHLSIKTARWRETVSRAILVAITALLLSFPEHIKLGMIWLSGTLAQTTGWGDSGFPPLSDALGTTLISQAFATVVGPEQVSSPGMVLLRWGSVAATGIALLLAVVGVSRGKAERIGLYRSLLLGGVIALEYLRFAGYSYGYAKGMAALTFLFATAMALGATEFWNQIRHHHRDRRHLSAVRLGVAHLTAAISALLLVGVLSINLALSAYVFWKPVGNIWDPRAWAASQFGRSLPALSAVQLSPNPLVGPESSFVTTYSFRGQELQGHFAVPAVAGQLGLPPRSIVDREKTSAAAVEVLGANEVAAVQGLLASDEIWSNSFLKAYRLANAKTSRPALRFANGREADPPGRLPVYIEPQGKGAQFENGKSIPSTGYLLVTLAADAPAAVDVASRHGRSTLQFTKGISVRSIPVEMPDRVDLSPIGNSQPSLLSAVVRTGGSSDQLEEDYPKVLAAVGSSSLQGEVITTRFTYLDVQMPVSHSLDIYNSEGTSHIGWFELPTNPDEHVTDVQFDVNGRSLEHRSMANGTVVQRRFTTSVPEDGEYVAYFSIWSGSTMAKRIPLYRYRLEGVHVADFESFPLVAVWDGRAESSNLP